MQKALPRLESSSVLDTAKLWFEERFDPVMGPGTCTRASCRVTHCIHGSRDHDLLSKSTGSFHLEEETLPLVVKGKVSWRRCKNPG